MIGCLERPFGGVEQLTHVAVLHLLKVAQLEHRALYIGQRGNSLLEQGLGFGAVEEIVGQQAGSYCRLFGADRLLLVAPQEIETLINGDAREPRADLRIPVEAVEAVPGFEERVLQHIVGILMGKYDTTYLPVQLFAVLAHHSLEGTSLRLWVQQLGG